MMEVPEDPDVSKVEVIEFKIFIINYATGFYQRLDPRWNHLIIFFQKSLIYSTSVIRRTRGQIVGILRKWVWLEVFAGFENDDGFMFCVKVWGSKL